MGRPVEDRKGELTEMASKLTSFRKIILKDSSLSEDAKEEIAEGLRKVIMLFNVHMAGD